MCPLLWGWLSHCSVLCRTVRLCRVMAYNYAGTVRPWPNFEPKYDAEILYKAMKGFGCNDKAVINVVCRRTCAQRQHIKIAFKSMYGKDLVQTLISELGGHLEDVIVALMTPLAEFDAQQLRKAMKGIGTTESVLIEIMCSRTSTQLKYIKQSYANLFHRDLEQDLHSETSGDFRKLLISLVTAARDESYNVNMQAARMDAKALYDAGEGRWGTDESTFNMILATRNFAQLNLVFREYQQFAAREMEESVQREFSGDIRTALLSVCKCIRNRPAYFAERLYYSMKGLGTDDDTLIRVVVSRSEIDMVQIKQMFHVMYKKPLQDWIRDDTSGKYREALIMLVNN